MVVLTDYMSVFFWRCRCPRVSAVRNKEKMLKIGRKFSIRVGLSKNETNLLMMISISKTFRCQFHQHFKSSVCANILAPKSTNLKCKYKKAVCKTFEQKKPNVKCRWNWPQNVNRSDCGEISILSWTDICISFCLTQKDSFPFSPLLGTFL